MKFIFFEVLKLTKNEIHVFFSESFESFIEEFTKMNPLGNPMFYFQVREYHSQLSFENLADDHAQMYVAFNLVMNVIGSHLGTNIHSFPGMNNGFDVDP